MQDAIIDLMAAGFASVAETAYEVSRPAQQLLERARAYIEANLADPGLNRDGVAAAMGMSVRRLNEIFAQEETSLATAIRTARLGQIARDLKDPRLPSQSISEIAMRWGLGNLQHFSRIFKDRYGCSPRDYRVRDRTLN